MSSRGRGRGGSYWCHQCTRSVRINASLVCPHCSGGFIEEEEVEEEEEGAWHPVVAGEAVPPNPFTDDHTFSQIMESLAAFFNSDEDENDSTSRRRRRRARLGMDLGGFNPLMFLQGATAAGGNWEILYDNGTGTGPSRLPGNLGDYFLGPGLDELIQQLADNDPNRYGTPPASKTAVEAMPTISITQDHLGTDSVQCAVCKDEFEMGSFVKQMPCKHLYHPDCILPWLAQHNSCPVCRYKMPTDDPDYNRYESRGSGDAGPSAPSQQPSNTSGRFQVPFRDFISMSQQAQAESGAGPANSGETVSSSPNDVQGSTARIDDDGDTVMSEAWHDQLD